MIKTFDKLEDVVQEIKPYFSRVKPSATPYIKEVHGIPVKLPEPNKLWRISEQACLDTLKYIFTISHQCYLLIVADSTPTMLKLMPPLQPIYKQALKQSVQKLKDNPHLRDKQRKRITDMHPARIMQCVVKERDREVKVIESNEYQQVFSKIQLSDGFFILNLTDAVIVRKDQTYPFHMVVGQQPLRHPPAMIPILSMSGQKGYLDIPMPNYDEISWVYEKEGQDIYANFVTEWDKKSIAKAVFRGGPTGCGYTPETNMRIQLLKLSQLPEYADLLDVGISGKGKTIDTASVKFDPVHGIGMLNTGLIPTDKFLNMAEQSNYQFIVHVDGNVNAYRLLYTMTTGSVILRVMSEYTSWAEQYLVPNEHYIAIEPDLSNLKLKMEWCMKNPRKCMEISARAQQLARTLLSREYLDQYFTMLFSTFSGETVEQSWQEYKRKRKKVQFERLPPADPSPRPARVAMIIPHRNRIDHLKELVRRLESFSLGPHQLDLYVIDQNNAEKFNRGLLLNIGFYLAKKSGYDRYLFHDVDSYPDETLFPQYFQYLEDTIHFASPSLGYKYTYPDFLGGVEGFTGEDYETVNGFPNTFLGWGGEDDALYNRLAAENITVYRPTQGKYILADHEPAKGSEKNMLRYENVLEDLKGYKENGIRQIPRYSIQVTPFSMDSFLDSYQLEKPNPVPVKSELSQFTMDPQKEKMNVYTFKVQYDLQKSKEPMPLPNVSLQQGLENVPANIIPTVQETVNEEGLYIVSILKESLSVPFQLAGRNMEQYFKSYAEEHIEGRCWKEGWVRPKSAKVVSYTAGLLNGTSIDYSILYHVEVCYPYEQMEVECIVRQVNKVGIRATLREKHNPMVLYITREHNTSLQMESFKSGQKIKVKVLGHRFEPGDPCIHVMAEMNMPENMKENMKE
jgi:DNA-directed RNA polymerase subunit E'/Rpb7